jgi:isoquinoline 1-oxidoreductase beta subunit
VLGFVMPGAGRFANAQQPPAKVYEPNAFLHIAPDNTRDGAGQPSGIRPGRATALPMLIAEELDADWSQVNGALAPAGEQYKDPAFGIQITGGSGSIAHSFIQYREIGAKARAMLIAAAAEQWKVPADQIDRASTLIGPAGQKATYGAWRMPP